MSLHQTQLAFYEVQWFTSLHKWVCYDVVQVDPRHLSQFLDHVYCTELCENEEERARWRIKRLLRPGTDSTFASITINVWRPR